MHFERSELRRPPVQEVAAGFQYEPKIPYSLVAGRLESRLRERLAVFEQNPNGIVLATEAGDAVGPLGRFSDGPSGRWVVQTGEGIVTINGVVPENSYNFEDFKEFVAFVLRAYRDAGVLDGIREASLRYINFIDAADTDPLDRPFRVHWSLPPSASERVRLSFSIAFADEVPVRVALHHGHRINDSTGTLLDLSTQDGSPADPEQWLRTAHDRVYQCFRHVLSDELHSKLEKSER